MIDGQTLRIERVRAGFRTQSELAQAIGCARNTINRAEQGRGGPAILHQLAKLLNVPAENLMRGSATKAAPQANANAISSEERYIINTLRKLDPIAHARAVGIVIGMAEGGGADDASALGADLMQNLASAEEIHTEQDNLAAGGGA